MPKILENAAITDNEVLNAQESVRIAEGRYRSGLGQFVDITVAQGLLLAAQSDQTQAHNALNQALVRLAFATGDDAKEIP